MYPIGKRVNKNSDKNWEIQNKNLHLYHSQLISSKSFLKPMALAP